VVFLAQHVEDRQVGELGEAGLACFEHDRKLLQPGEGGAEFRAPTSACSELRASLMVCWRSTERSTQLSREPTTVCAVVMASSPPASEPSAALAAEAVLAAPPLIAADRFLITLIRSVGLPAGSLKLRNSGPVSVRLTDWPSPSESWPAVPLPIYSAKPVAALIW